MPKENEDGQEKTEQPTERQRIKSREEGQVAQSRELNSFAVLLGGMAALVIFGGWMMNRLTGMVGGIFTNLESFQVNPGNLPGYIAGAAGWLLTTISPVLIVVVVVGILINLVQFEFKFTTKPLEPKLSKMNPVKGLKRLVNQRAAVTLLTNIAKMAAIGFVAYKAIIKSFPDFPTLVDATVGQIFLYLVDTIFGMYIWILALLLVIALIDFAYQRYQHQENLKMTKDEVKDERKMQEGDPKVKAQIRKMQFQMAFNTMIKELPEADVIVTNPVHVAVALKYDPEKMDAPKVIGKGLRKLAERIKRIAAENDIPIIENPPLARALYKSCEIGEEIPGQFYQDVAEIISYIYQLRGEVIDA